VPWSGQSLNTVVGSRGPAHASWTPTFPVKEVNSIKIPGNWKEVMKSE
jgi:hypothetical protein